MFISSKEDGPVELIAEWTLLRETKVNYEKIKLDGVFKVPNGLEKNWLCGYRCCGEYPAEGKKARADVCSLSHPCISMATIGFQFVSKDL